MFTLEADLVWGVSFFLLYLHLYDLLCSPTASPGTAWVPATPQQCFCSDSLWRPGTVSRLAVVGHLQQCPSESAIVRKHVHVSFLAVVGGRSQSHWQLVKPGRARASLTPAHVPLPTFQSRCFPVWEMGLEQSDRKMWDANDCLHSKRPCSCQLWHGKPKPEPEFSQGGWAWGQLVWYANCPGPLIPKGRWLMLCPSTNPSQSFLGPWWMVKFFPPSQHLKWRKCSSQHYVFNWDNSALVSSFTVTPVAGFLW